MMNDDDEEREELTYTCSCIIPRPPVPPFLSSMNRHSIIILLVLLYTVRVGLNEMGKKIGSSLVSVRLFGGCMVGE